MNRRVGAGGAAIFFCGAYDAADIHVKTAIAVVSGARFERIVMDGSVGFRGSGRVLQLVAIALRELRRLPDLGTELLEIRWIRAAASIGVGVQLRIDVADCGQ